MGLELHINDINKYLLEDEIIDFNSKIIVNLSDKLLDKSKNKLEYIKNAYEYVRDNISHSADISNDLITCRASEVLKAGHGVCFAKSHLLAAILRCKSIPAGLCYQKIILDDKTAPILALHGLNGVYIEEYNKWIRLDPRGNKKGVNAQFSIDTEKLAFPIRKELGEEDIKIIYEKTDKNVLKALTDNKTRAELWKCIPSELAYRE